MFSLDKSKELDNCDSEGENGQYVKTDLGEIFARECFEAKMVNSKLKSWLETPTEQSTACAQVESKLRGIFGILQECFVESTDSRHRNNVLLTIHTIASTHPTQAYKYWLMEYKGNLLQHVVTPREEKVLIGLLQCFDIILTNGQVEEHLSAGIEHELLDIILKLHYKSPFPIRNPRSLEMLQFATTSMNLLNRLALSCSTEFKEYIPEVLGLCVSYVDGLSDGENYQRKDFNYPQKVIILQRQYDIDSNKGELGIGDLPRGQLPGKVARPRKFRTTGRPAVLQQQSQIVTIENQFKELHNEGQTTIDNCALTWASLCLLDKVINQSMDRRDIPNLWGILLPSGHDCEDEKHLLLVAQRHQGTSVKCRSLALQITANVVLNSKQLLCQAQDESHNHRSSSAFVPFSLSLFQSIKAVYASLGRILETEKSLPVLIQDLKCLAILIQNTPFHRFQSAVFLEKLIKDVRKFVYHRDSSVQVSSLMVMESLIAIPDIKGELRDAIGLPPLLNGCPKSKGLERGAEFAIEEDLFDENNSTEKANLGENLECPCETSKYKVPSCLFWLLERIMQNLETKTPGKSPIPVRLSSLQVLTVMATHFSVVKDHLNKIACLLKFTMQDPTHDVRLYGARCMETFTHHINLYLQPSQDKQCPTASSPCEEFWQIILPILLLNFTDSLSAGSLKVCLCDVLSNMGETVFDSLPNRVRMNLLGLLSGVSSDIAEEPAVRAAAVRVLSIFVLFPSLRTDLVFVENVAELALPLMRPDSSNPSVRIKASWSMANLSDVYLQYPQEKFSDGLLERLLNSAIEACQDNDKVRCNAVRTLGNLLSILNMEHLEQREWRLILQDALNKITDCLRASGNAKVKWNTCYAISNFLRNRALFAITEKYVDLQWQKSLYEALCHLIINHNNFKVRINATAALAKIPNRAAFSDYYETVWCSLLDALERSHNLENFYEYNHRDSLQEHLCLALSHTIRCSSSEQDFLLLKKHLMKSKDIAHNTWTRVVNRMLPEKLPPLLACPIFLQEQQKANAQGSTELKSALSILANTFPIT